MSYGFVICKKTVNGENYVSNRLNYHPDGADDNYIPRARRNSYDETFGQKLHSSLYMLIRLAYSPQVIGNLFNCNRSITSLGSCSNALVISL